MMYFLIKTVLIIFSFNIKVPAEFNVLDFWVSFWWQETLKWLALLVSTWYIFIQPHNNSLFCLKLFTYTNWFHNIGVIWNKNHLPLISSELSASFIHIIRYTHILLLTKNSYISTRLWRCLHLWNFITNSS